MMKQWLMMAMVALTCSLFADKPDVKGAELGEWTMDVPAAEALAKKTGKPMFINFTGSDWCGWCMMMDKKVFSQDAWEDFAEENLVLVWIDSPKDKSLVPQEYVARNNALKDKYGIRGFPTYVLVDAEGNILGQLGADQNATPETFIMAVRKLTLLKEIDTLLSAEDLAAYKKVKAAQADLDARVKAWMEKAQKEAAALEAEEQTLKSEEDELIKKALQNVK